jgi:hypothetical protein
MSDDIDLGPCCACGVRGLVVRNIVALDVRGPSPSQGWGCLVCHLPANGAVAVVCDACLDQDVPITHICVGYPGEGKRASRADYTEPFRHDEGRHALDHLGLTANN